ncbi:MAG: UDP-N-acetylglucosamine 2-epimerase (non-hydrolyzing) [Clostridiales bacterium]|jgi:UDP-N-acetylglucosamine 2-epimerase (non-hydrolysing)|nr:UDP-N-acetylglucosamine 2-epimerase (non-hydrolyzing) [Clostridiales bacterium]
MDKIKVLSVFGTRPEATKMIPLVKAIEADPDTLSIVCVSAQHRNMLDQVLDIFDVKPDYDLDIMRERQSLSYITSSAMDGVYNVIKEAEPDIVLVHGDTTTTFAAALGAFYAKCAIGHVEAGLRTYDKYQPYPEEMNRKLTGSLADIHFSPTLAAKNNLLKENVNEDTIFVTGNTAIDCTRGTVRGDYVFSERALNNIDFKSKRVIAVTAHRRENIGEPLENICEAFDELIKKYDDVEIVYAVHSNPVVIETAERILGGKPRIHLLPPLDILDMHNLMGRSYMVMSDSGGLQEEAPAFSKPVIVLRDVTERPEGIVAGTLVLAGTRKEDILMQAERLLADKNAYNAMANAKNPFGDGYASQRIVEAIKYYFKKTDKRPEDFA